MKHALLVLSLLVPYWPQCAVASVPPSSPDNSKIEAIVGYRVDRSGISFQLTSGGCTTQSDFIPQVEMTNQNVVEVTLFRIRPDTCYPFIPTPFEAHFSFQAMGFDKSTHFTIKNPNGIALGWIW